MAKTFCIPKSTALQMKEAVKNGEVSIKDLYDAPNSEARRVVFEKFASKELAKEINTAFEKAMVSKQKTALKDWAEKVFTPSQKKEASYKGILERIDELDSLGVLNDANSKSFLSDLVADRLGISVTPQEIKMITENANKLETEFAKPTEDGIPSVDYWVARKEMDNYLNSLNPSHQLKVATSIGGRGAMLLSVKSPLTNIISNTVNGAVQGFERRLASLTAAGLNNDFALEYVKKVNNIYQKSGFDISRMESIASNQVRLGEDVVSSQGKGAVRAIGRWYEDIVFKQLMGAPDVASASISFADSANLASTKLAKGDKAKALEIFKDATRLEPKTIDGEIVRSQAIADAKYATYTNKGGYSDLAMAIRTALNNASGDIRFGDQLMPFVKTPANVVQAGVDAAGVGAFKGFYKLPEAIKEMKVGNGEPMQEVVRLFVRSGLGMTLAVVLAHMFNPDDFIGEYDNLTSKEKSLVAQKGATYNSIKIGDKYVSLDYFGPLASSFVGFMYARKYGENLPEQIFQYGRGVVTQAAKVPGLREFSDLVSNVQDAATKGKLGDIAAGLTNEAVAYIRARVIPAIVNDVAKGTDSKERQTDKGQLSKFKSSIPGLRQTLPSKVNQLTGEEIEGQGFIQTILFGSRVKNASNSKLITEVSRLNDVGESPTMSSIEKSSKRFKQLKEQIGDDKFNEAIKFYGTEYGKKANARIEATSYKNKTDEEKKKLLNKIRNDVMDATLAKYHYKKPKKQE